MSFSLDTHCTLEDQAWGPATPVLGWNSGVLTSAGSNGSVEGPVVLATENLPYYMKIKDTSTQCWLSSAQSPMGSHKAAR